MTTTRKIRRDSLQGQLNAFAAAQSADVLQWPDSVTLPADPAEAATAKMHFSNLQKGRARSHWRPHHSTLMAEVALMSGQIAKLTEMLTKSGAVIRTEKGHLTRSPLLDALSMVVSLRTQNLKSLGLVGDHAERDGAAHGQNQARQTLGAFNDPDSLLAGFSDDLLGRQQFA